MRTVIIIVAGVALLGILVGIARMCSWRIRNAVHAFVAAWFVAAAANMWIGVSQAGYSFMEELPIFLAIFLIPAAAAMALLRKLS